MPKPPRGQGGKRADKSRARFREKLVAKTASNANMIVEDKLKSLITGLEKAVRGDVISFIGSLVYGAEEEVREAVEALHPQKRRGGEGCVGTENFRGYN